jgi:hypothetical protein
MQMSLEVEGSDRREGLWRAAVGAGMGEVLGECMKIFL